MLYNKIYNTLRKSPNILRKPLYLIPIKYRFGGSNFTDTYDLLKETEKWDKEKILLYQKKQLQKLLKHAVEHVPFYSDISLSSNNPLKDLLKFPIMDKKEMQKNIDAFIADNVPIEKTFHVTTGGTSGDPFCFNIDNSAFGKEWAFKTTGWRRVGFKPGDKVISFRGVEFINTNKEIYWQDNPIYNMLEMSPFHMNDKTLPKYIQKIRKFKPKYLHGYPSAVSILAKYVEREEIQIPKIKAFLAISENVYPWQREIIERAFDTRLFSFYGLSEKVIMAHECEHDIKQHAFPEYGITEILDKEGNPVNEGEEGELVGTGFLNYYMPFIRYRTGDYAVLGGQECKCKRSHLILEDLRGKDAKELMIVGKSGSLFALHALYFTIHSDVFRNVYRIQFRQSNPGEINLKIIPQTGFSDMDRKGIIDAIYKRAGDDLEINLEEVNEIELTHRGKSKLFIQDLNTEKWSV